MNKVIYENNLVSCSIIWDTCRQVAGWMIYKICLVKLLKPLLVWRKLTVSFRSNRGAQIYSTKFLHSDKKKYDGIIKHVLLFILCIWDRTERCSQSVIRQFLVTNSECLIKNKPQNCEPRAVPDNNSHLSLNYTLQAAWVPNFRPKIII